MKLNKKQKILFVLGIIIAFLVVIRLYYVIINHSTQVVFECLDVEVSLLEHDDIRSIEQGNFHGLFSIHEKTTKDIVEHSEKYAVMKVLLQFQNKSLRNVYKVKIIPKYDVNIVAYDPYIDENSMEVYEKGESRKFYNIMLVKCDNLSLEKIQNTVKNGKCLLEYSLNPEWDIISKFNTQT